MEHVALAVVTFALYLSLINNYLLKRDLKIERAKRTPWNKGKRGYKINRKPKAHLVQLVEHEDEVLA